MPDEKNVLPAEDRLHKLHDVSRSLGVCTRTISGTWRRKGLVIIQVERKQFIKESDLRTFLNRHRIERKDVANG
ncbi:MAG: hypothetical protein ACTHN5_12165 [Phycisphaerae bacterium]